MNKLEETLAAASLDPQARIHFYREIIHSKVFVPSQLSATGENLWLHMQKDNENWVPFFTSLEKASAFVDPFKKKVKIEKLKADDFFRSLSTNSQSCLNPGGDLSKIFLWEEMQALLKGDFNESAFPAVRLRDEHYELRASTSAFNSSPLLRALTSYAQSNSKIDGLYVAEFVERKTGSSHPIVAIATSLRDRLAAEDLIVEMCLLAQDYCEQGMPIDFCLVNELALMKDGIKRGLARNVYERSLSA